LASQTAYYYGVHLPPPPLHSPRAETGAQVAIGAMLARPDQLGAQNSNSLRLICFVWLTNFGLNGGMRVARSPCRLPFALAQLHLIAPNQRQTGPQTAGRRRSCHRRMIEKDGWRAR